jgi:hypothetical protein
LGASQAFLEIGQLAESPGRHKAAECTRLIHGRAPSKS